MVKPVEPEWGALAGDGPLSPAEIDAQARALLAQMTLVEKIKQMSGDRSFLFGGIKMARAYNAEPVPAGENHRLGIPGIRFTDGPRGVVMYHSTCFPVAMAAACPGMSNLRRGSGRDRGRGAGAGRQLLRRGNLFGFFSSPIKDSKPKKFKG